MTKETLIQLATEAHNCGLSGHTYDHPLDGRRFDPEKLVQCYLPEWQTGQIIPDPTGPSILVLERNNDTYYTAEANLYEGKWDGQPYRDVCLLQILHNPEHYRLTGRWLIQTILLP